jgi:hypothetical protein
MFEIAVHGTNVAADRTLRDAKRVEIPLLKRERAPGVDAKQG